MAARAVDSGEIKDQEEIQDITTCCICTEIYTDPKALPCIHTFCMKCIQETGLKCSKGPGDEMPCPICRRLFKIPTEGFIGLPRHFFIERLIDMSKASTSSSAMEFTCSLCLEENNHQLDAKTPTAEEFCVVCKYKLCNECCSEHRKFKATKNHKLIPINEYETGQTNIATSTALMICEVHKEKVLDVYCTDCKTVVCVTCFIEGHKRHEGSHIDECVDGFRKQIDNNIAAMKECVAKVQIKKTELVRAKKELLQSLDGLECDIEKRKSEIRQLLNEHSSDLVQSICSKRKGGVKEIQVKMDDIDAYLSNIESYNSYCEKIMAEGSSSDICRALSNLSIRASELQQQSQPIIEREILNFKFCFRQIEIEKLIARECGNLVGEIQEEGELNPQNMILTEQSDEIDILRKENDRLKQKFRTNSDNFLEQLNSYKATVKTLETDVEKLRKELGKVKAGELRYKSEPVLVKTIKTKASEEKKSIRGLTILGGELFTVSQTSSVVEIYDTTDLNLSRRLSLKELTDPWDIGSCNRNNCLYIFDQQGQVNKILRIDPNGKFIKKWSTGNECGRLSVTCNSSVILVASRTSKLNEYSPDGHLIRAINLTGVRYPWHAVQLDNGHFVVSHSDEVDDLHRVCIVDSDGCLKKSFGGKCGQMNRPVYLAVDENGYVMVADYQNNRLFLLDSNLKFQREILSKVLRNPARILLAESTGRLFVAVNEANNQRILVFAF